HVRFVSGHAFRHAENALHESAFRPCGQRAESQYMVLSQPLTSALSVFPLAGVLWPRFWKEESGMLNRRSFLSSSFASSLAVGAGLAGSGNLWAQLESLPPKLPEHSLYDQDEDAYWREMRKQFLIPPDEIYLNNGTVGSSPAPVLRAVFAGYEACEKLNEADPEDYPIWGYASWNQFRDPLAAFVGCNRDEIALLRNATEANSYIANGVDLKPGDEVLMTDQEHPGGEHPWNLKAKR